MRLKVPIAIVLGALLTVPGLAAGQAGVPSAPPTPPAGQAAAKEDADLDINYAVVDFSLVNLPTTLRLPRHKSAFRVTHRFARPLGDGSFGDLVGDLFGFDSHAQVGLEFRVAPIRGGELRLYRTNDKTIEISGKYSVLPQDDQWPLAVSGVVSVEGANNFRDTYSPSVGVLVSREITERAVLALEVIWVGNTNPLASAPGEPSHTLMFGFGARVRVSRTAYVVAETAPRAAGFDPGSTPVSVGIEKNVGGHVFQLNVSNSVGNTLGQIARGGPSPRRWFLGFNISRKFY